MFFIVRFAYKITKKAKIPLSFSNQDGAFKQLKLNMLVTTLHVLLILAYTVLCFFSFVVVVSAKSQYRLYTSVTMLGGILDLFLACMIWFILDEEYQPDLVVDEERKISYHVLDVVLRNSNGEVVFDDAI